MRAPNVLRAREVVGRLVLGFGFRLECEVIARRGAKQVGRGLNVVSAKGIMAGWLLCLGTERAQGERVGGRIFCTEEC